MDNIRKWPEIAGGDERLEEICYRKALEVYGDLLPAEVSSRIDWELEAIRQQKTAFLFLYLREILEQCGLTAKDVQLAGTGTNSMIAYLCGISYFNPMELGLSPYFTFGYHMDVVPFLDLYVPADLQQQVMAAAGTLEGLDRALRASCLQVDEAGTEELAPHPCGIFYIPKGTDLAAITDTFVYDGETCAKRVYYEIDDILYKQNVIASDNLQKLYELQRSGAYQGTFSISRLNREQISAYRDVTFFDSLVKVEALKHDTLELNALAHVGESDCESFRRTMATREDVYEYLLQLGLGEEQAYTFTVHIGKGHIERQPDKYADLITALEAAGAEDWFIDFCHKCGYLFSRGHIVASLRVQLSVRYPEFVTE